MSKDTDRTVAGGFRCCGGAVGNPQFRSAQMLPLSGRSGSVMLEFVMAFPLILLLMLGCMQITHIWIARQVTVYAAYCAARAALVVPQDEYPAAGKQAAEQVCAWAIIGQAEGEPEKVIPGWGTIPGTGAIGRGTKVVTMIRQVDPWNVSATVTFDFGLVMPVAGPVIGWLVNPWNENSEWLEQRADDTGNMHRFVDSVQYPHVRFRETVVLSKPYVTLPLMGVPSGGW